jgi:tetratricopeptide (TPR) repeat protein
MKKTFLFLLVAVVALFSAHAQTSADMSDAARTRLEKAITLMDTGMAETAIEILNNLDKEYPNNYNVLYEMCYAYWVLGEKMKALEILKRLEDHPAATFMVYHLEGNCLDEMGKPKEAIKAYNRGLERFPDAALLYVEQGRIAQKKEDYNQAVELYEKAIEVDPGHPSAYCCLTMLYADTSEPFWGIMYGEAARMLCLHYDTGTYGKWSAQISELIYNLYKEHINITNKGDSTVIQTTFTKMNEISITKDSSQVFLPLPMAFDKEMLKALKPEKEITLQSLIDVRGRFIDSFYEQFNDYYDVSILDFQRQVRESGHWQAYNMYLLALGDMDAYQQWESTDPTAGKQMDAFARWYNDHLFTPSTEHPTLRPKAYRLINLAIPAREQVSNAKDCSKYSADVLRLARWYLDQPLDTNSYIQDQVQRFLVTWCINSDEISIEIRDCSIAESGEGMMAMLFAMIEYGLEHKVKNLGEEGFAYAFKRALAYLDKNRAVVDVPQLVEECLKMTPSQLDQRIHEEYNIPVVSREIVKP